MKNWIHRKDAKGAKFFFAFLRALRAFAVKTFWLMGRMRRRKKGDLKADKKDGLRTTAGGRAEWVLERE